MSGSSKNAITLLFIFFFFSPLLLQAENKKAVVVGIDTVLEKSHGENLKAIGSLVAREQVYVTSQVEGFIEHINIKDGIQVKAGQPLIAMDCRFAQAKRNEARAKLSEDVRRLQELQDLVAKKAAPKSELDSQQSLVAQSQAAFQAADTILNYYSIRAPFSGVLAMSQLSKGQYIRPGDPLVILVNLDQLYVDFNLPSRYLSQVKTGQHLLLLFEAWPGKLFEAVISGVDPIINADSRNLSIRANIDNSGHLLFPGLLAEITLRLPASNMFAVKTNSILYKGNQAYVYRINSDNRVALSAVSTGSIFGDKTFILSGLKAGDRVVSQGVVKLSDGMEVIAEPLTLPLTIDKPLFERSS